MTEFMRARFAGLFTVAVVSLVSCGGGQQEPAASPEPASMPEAPAPAEPAPEGGEGTHTMPDGTTMPGEQHGESPPPASDEAPKEK